MNCTFNESEGFPAKCIDCGRIVQRGVFPIYAQCPAKTSSSFSEVVREAHAALDRGPGTELSNLLKKIGIEPTPACACRAKAAQMNAWGYEECSKPERIEEVVAVMREEAKARGLPFVDIAARLLVRRAIHNARKAEARRAQRPSHHYRREALAPPGDAPQG